jgi:penicillin-binding protein 1C
LNDLVQLYAGLANGGAGKPLIWRTSDQSKLPRRMMSPSAAWQVGHILASIPPPQGSAARAGEIAYKTGTSYGHRDAWALGYDGAHVIGVWLGRPDGTPVPGAFGGDLAAPILFEAFGSLKARPTPMPPPPPETMILSTAALPTPLQRFRPRDGVFARGGDAPTVRFPPHGAVLRGSGEGIPLKLRAGTLPLTVLVDGAPLLTNLRRREVLLPLSGPGFTRISVIDATGQAAEIEIRLD